MAERTEQNRPEERNSRIDRKLRQILTLSAIENDGFRFVIEGSGLSVTDVLDLDRGGVSSFSPTGIVNEIEAVTCSRVVHEVLKGSRGYIVKKLGPKPQPGELPSEAREVHARLGKLIEERRMLQRVRALKKDIKEAVIKVHGDDIFRERLEEIVANSASK